MPKVKVHPRKRLVRLYIDIARGTYWLVKFTDADETLEIGKEWLIKALELLPKRGRPFDCWLAIAIRLYAEANPDAFSHRVLHPYVLRSRIYLVDRFKNGQPSHAVRYFHNLRYLIRQFDKLTTVQFLKLIEDKDISLIMRPARTGGSDKADSTRKYRERTQGNKQPSISKGALQRAKDAGLVPLSS
jgi:hypothetical protein